MLEMLERMLDHGRPCAVVLISERKPAFVGGVARIAANPSCFAAN